jgi:hypothetical protein
MRVFCRSPSELTAGNIGRMGRRRSSIAGMNDREGEGSESVAADLGARKIVGIGNARSLKARLQNPQAVATRRISEITIGVLHRRDLGDIDALAASIAAIALLHPFVVRPDGVLIAGERRLAACKSLCWDRVPVMVVDLDQIVCGEFAENNQRKDFTLSEAVAIKRAIEPIERAEAKKRPAAAGPASGRGKKDGSGSGKLLTPVRGRAARGQS